MFVCTAAACIIAVDFSAVRSDRLSYATVANGCMRQKQQSKYVMQGDECDFFKMGAPIIMQEVQLPVFECTGIHQ